MIIPSKSYFDRIQRACRNHDVLLVVDEVATGFGRTGCWFAIEHFDLRPDILLLGKGINSGYLPLGAVLFSAQIGDCLATEGEAIIHGSSHNGNPACCAAALAALDIMERDGLVERSRELGHYFIASLRSQSSLPGLGLIRGLGLMLFAGLCDEAGTAANQTQVLAISEAMQREGVLVYPAPGGIMFLPALVITHRQIDAVVSCLVSVLLAHRLVGGELVARDGANQFDGGGIEEVTS